MEHADDPTIERVRAARRAVSERCHHEPTEVVAYYMALQKKYQDRLVVGEGDPLLPVQPAVGQ